MQKANNNPLNDMISISGRSSFFQQLFPAPAVRKKITPENNLQIMNSNRSQRPHFARTLTRQKQKLENPKHRMLCLIMKRVGYSKIRNYFQHVKKYGEEQYTVLDGAFRRVARNVEFCKLMAWRKLAFWAKIKKREDHLVKFIMYAAEKSQNYSKRIAFKSINNYGLKKINIGQKLLQSSKSKFLKFALFKLSKRVQSQTFLKLKVHYYKSTISQQKYKYLSKTLHSLTLGRLHNSWSKMMGLSNSQHNDIEHQLGQLNKQMNIMRKELSRKNKQIIQLEMQLSTKNQESRYYNYYSNNSNGRINRNVDRSLENSRRSMKSIGSKRGISEEKDKEKDKIDLDNINTSALSWLNGSFMSIKSGKSSMSKSITGMDCYCKYRQKYTQYKAQTSSLRNQLQIIKSQLEVTKDLNQHLQQQISNLCTTTSNNDKESNIQLQALRAELKQLKKQKQSMKEKLLYNQKYIVNLKCQFKNKIQGLYRNLRKNN